MDNFHIDIVSEGERDLRSAMDIAFRGSPDPKAEGYLVHPEKGLVFFWYLTNAPRVQLSIPSSLMLRLLRILQSGGLLSRITVLNLITTVTTVRAGEFIQKAGDALVDGMEPLLLSNLLGRCTVSKCLNETKSTDPRLRPWYYGHSVKGFKYIPFTEDGENINHFVSKPDGSIIELIVDQKALWNTVLAPELDKAGNPKINPKTKAPVLCEVRCNWDGFVKFRAFSEWVEFYLSKPSWLEGFITQVNEQTL